MSRKVVAGNWKMNLNYNEALSLFNSVNTISAKDVEIIVAPASIYLAEFSKCSGRVKLAAQNVSNFKSGQAPVSCFYLFRCLGCLFMALFERIIINLCCGVDILRSQTFLS